MLLKKKIPMRYVLGKIKVELLLTVLFTIAFQLIHSYFVTISLSIPIAIPTMIGTIISLLLAFKSNQAYDRWWEARIIWGSIVNDSRTLVRQLITFYKDPDFSVDAINFKENFAKRQIAWCYSLSATLRGKDATKSIKRLLSDDDFRFVKRHKHVPNALLILNAKDLKIARQNKRLSTYQQVELDNTLSRLCDAMGKCERIKNTIFPTTYSMYTRFALCLFIMLLPFSLIELLGWLSVPLITTIAAAFFLIEKMAIHLQDPFENRPTDTPMNVISENIEKNLMQMIDEYRDEYSSENELVIEKNNIRLTYANNYFIL